MFLTVHSTAGIFIGLNVTNPGGAFLTGWLSHYFLDIIPHGDENFKDTTIKGMATKALFDHALVLINLFIIWRFFAINLLAPPIIAGLIGSVLPDYLMGIHKLTANKKLNLLKIIHKILDYFEDFHSYCHFNIIKYECSIQNGMITQATFLLLLWIFILI